MREIQILDGQKKRGSTKDHPHKKQLARVDVGHK